MEYSIEFDYAKKVIREAAELIIATESIEILSSNAKDIKLSLDKQLDLFILKKLSHTFKYPILSEENGQSQPINENDPCWILDPIDGSMNLSRGIPFSAISLAFWKGNDPIFGVIYDFNRDEMLSGYVGIGAWLNEKNLEPTEPKVTSQSILATGIPKDMDLSEVNKKDFLDTLIQFKKVRMLGSAAISMLYVATGKVDAYMEKDIMLWDIAAGLSILKALEKTPSQFVIKKNYCVDIQISN